MRITKKFHKIALAEIQLHRAIVLFLEDKEYPSSITLAGAAEEVLGKYVVKAGGQAAVEYILDSIENVPEAAGMDRKELRDVHMNGVKNSLKHIGDLTVDHVEKDWETEAINLIIRASINYRVLAGVVSEHIRAFIVFIRTERPDLFEKWGPKDHDTLNAILEQNPQPS